MVFEYIFRVCFFLHAFSVFWWFCVMEFVFEWFFRWFLNVFCVTFKNFGMILCDGGFGMIFWTYCLWFLIDFWVIMCDGMAFEWFLTIFDAFWLIFEWFWWNGFCLIFQCWWNGFWMLFWTYCLWFLIGFWMIMCDGMVFEWVFAFQWFLIDFDGMFLFVFSMVLAWLIDFVWCSIFGWFSNDSVMMFEWFCAVGDLGELFLNDFRDGMVFEWFLTDFWISMCDTVIWNGFWIIFVMEVLIDFWMIFCPQISSKSPRIVKNRKIPNARKSHWIMLKNISPHSESAGQKFRVLLCETIMWIPYEYNENCEWGDLFPQLTWRKDILRDGMTVKTLLWESSLITRLQKNRWDDLCMKHHGPIFDEQKRIGYEISPLTTNAWFACNLKMAPWKRDSF